MLFCNMCLLTVSDLQRIFEKLDMNCDGFVSLEELHRLLEKIGNCQYSLDELESLVEKKSFDFNEFLFLYNSIMEQNNGESRGGNNNDDDGGDVMGELESDLVKTFKVFDLDGDGFITSQELECVLKRLGLWDGKDCITMIRFYDTNSDGRLDFQEFRTMMLLTKA
ncbi:hypothetical protein RJT34_09700 [Clitoria ternatea]|uniref:EF-hand domain-containing protein n=1 Tax=Clitoria ternatea TaxID=43366 RepID=A0AAN9K5X6_CLITE